MAEISDIIIGTTVAFQSKAVNDNNFYTGKVIGTVTSLLAKTYTDIYTYNTSVQSADANVPDANLQTYFMIKLLEQVDNTDKYVIPFSADWINLPTLKIIATDRVATIKVYEVDTTNIQNVIDLLMAGGFKARVELLS